ncbi:MAG: cation:proton antiporter [Thermotogota bacterium]
MAFSLAAVIILGLTFKWLFEKIKLPGILGMLVLGMIMGQYALDWLSPEIMNVSTDLRKIALIIILLRAGLGISKSTLKKVGKPAIKLSFIPNLLEGFAIAFSSMWIFDLSFIEGGILGFIIAAVSPAVVVPSMLRLMERGKGKKKSIPTMILAGASVDDVIAITLFSTFLGLHGGENINIPVKLLEIPFSIALGIGLGIILGFIFVKFFSKYHIRDTKKVLFIIATSIFLTTLEDLLSSYIQVASLLGVMTIGFILLEKKQAVAHRLARKFEKIWVFAEILLFVLVGAQVNLQVALESGIKGLLLIIIGLSFRSLGVLISLRKSGLNKKEKIFSIVGYIPKATVQAAIGAVPLAAGMASGNLILALAVLSIIFTAPLGAFGIKVLGDKFLD